MEPHVDDERQPLLQTPIQDSHRLSSDEDQNQSSGLHDSRNLSDPKEPSNGQLAVILGSIWVRSETYHYIDVFILGSQSDFFDSLECSSPHLVRISTFSMLPELQILPFPL